MSIDQLFTKIPLIPVVSLNHVDDALPLAEALLAANISVMEIALRTPVALACVEALRRHCPQMTAGVGNVLNTQQLQAAQEAGAQFAATPGFSLPLIQMAKDIDMPYLPGVMTVSEIMVANDLGLRLLKFFPAESAGGEGFLRAMHTVFADMMFIATGGIHAQNIKHYLPLPNVLAVGGTFLAPADLIAAKDWAVISELASATLMRAKRVE